jgi:hypothetical protein
VIQAEKFFAHFVTSTNIYDANAEDETKTEESTPGHKRGGSHGFGPQFSEAPGES